jgi:hypothetical protein
MMKVNFLKRLESSIESFQVSMDRTIKKIESLENKIIEFERSKNRSLEMDLSSLEPDENELEENPEDIQQWEVGKKLKFKFEHLELNRWLKDLEKDRQALNDLYNNASAIIPERDAKLYELKKIIENKFRQPLNAGNRKLIVFTAFADTAQYLFENLREWIQNKLKANIALVAGNKTITTFGKNDFNHILTNFSPGSKNRNLLASMPQEGEIDILIATDCISEGQNLQDCDYLVNYDIHWNPVRIIQRFGRIDRLGSRNDKIQLVNFWPTKDLDNYINLKERVEARMALVDVTATGEDNILNTEQLEDLITDELKYRNQQLKRLQKEVLDIEELDQAISLTDFTLDDFRIELSQFIQHNKKHLEETPLGLYAIVPSPNNQLARGQKSFSETEKEIIQPGVIYCLYQKGDTKGAEEVNPLQPYFLVYIRNDGTVRYNYINAKQILEIYRLLCHNEQVPYKQLCDLFNKETEKGQNMEVYSRLLNTAIEEIRRIFRKRVNQKLTSDRGALLIPKEKQAAEAGQFELITWLIIR